MTIFYTFRFKESEEESSGMFAEFLGEEEGDDMSVTLFASEYPHFISENLDDAKETLSQVMQENPELMLEIVKVTQQIEVVT